MAQTAENNWYLREWMRHFDKRQSALVNELGWDKAKANFVWHDKQQYRRDVVNAVAEWLGIAPYELLMPPKRALAFRRLREIAREIVADEAAEAEAPQNDKRGENEDDDGERPRKPKRTS